MKIVVIGPNAYAILLKKYFRKSFIIKYFDSIYDNNLNKLKDIKRLISMT